MDRRDFIRLTAVTGTSVTLASCGNPEHQLIRFVPDDDLVPGVAEFKPSVCPLCRAGCGLSVRVMEADVETVRNGQSGVVKMGVAKKLEGDAKHPISRGGLCPRGQAAIQITYHPDRLTHPMKRTGARGTGEYKEVTWDEAIAELAGQLIALADARDQKSLALLARPRRSRRLELFAEFLARFGAPAPVGFELFAEDVLRRANARSFGHEQLPTFDLARAKYVIAFGADFLGTWNSPVSQNAGYGEMRQGRQVHGGSRAKFVHVEPRMSLTAASADEFVPAKPGTEGVLALGLGHIIIRNKLRSADAAGRAGAAIDGWSAGLADYTPENVEKITGVAALRIERLAHELVEFRPSVAIIGGAPLAHTNGLFNALAVNALNALLGSVGEPGGMFFTPSLQPPASGPGFSAASHPPSQAAPASAGQTQPLVASLQSSKVLLIDDANPVFASPKAWKVREALDRIPFIVSFGSFLDDTSIHADLILPDHSFLETWVDSMPESGALEAVTTVAGPAMKPLHNTRSTPDVVIELAGKLKSPVALPWKSYEEMLKAPATSHPPSQAAPASAGQASHQPPVTSHQYQEPHFDGDAAAFPFHFLPYASQAFLDGSAAHLPWLQEMPDPLTSAMWSSWIEINPRTAERLGLALGDLVDVTSSQGTLRAPIVISPGIAPDVVAMPVGQGHETFTRYASKRGVNPIEILSPLTEAETGALAWAATRVKITRAGDGDGRLIMFAGEMRENPFEGRRQEK
ncbi:MAG: molybdopterin-dependent oxidoreductase [Acidobacteria bacterium]|nr:molybdopterin-dependent oxidoreductase [Acidobacteriota bacterium]